DIEKIISSGYGKTAKVLAEEIVTYLTPKSKNYFDLFVKERYNTPDIKFEHSGKLLTAVHYDSIENDIITVDIDLPSIPYGWSPIPKLELLEETAEDIVTKVNSIKNKAHRNEIKEHGF